jgi:small-conductance mechanosensitive channel
MNNLLLNREIDQDEFSKFMKIRRRLMNKQYARKSRQIKTLKMEEISKINARLEKLIVEKNEIIKSLQQKLNFYIKNEDDYMIDQYQDAILIDDIVTPASLT